jgi:hypothetical protein
VSIADKRRYRSRATGIVFRVEAEHCGVVTLASVRNDKRAVVADAEIADAYTRCDVACPHAPVCDKCGGEMITVPGQSESLGWVCWHCGAAMSVDASEPSLALSNLKNGARMTNIETIKNIVRNAGGPVAILVEKSAADVDLSGVLTWGDDVTVCWMNDSGLLRSKDADVYHTADAMVMVSRKGDIVTFSVVKNRFGSLPSLTKAVVENGEFVDAPRVECSARERSPSEFTTEATYEIHDNGGRPLVVTVSSSKITVAPRLDAETPLLAIEGYASVFVGVDSEEHEHGNSILVHECSNRYLYIGSEVYRFDADDTIIEYASPIGNNDVPYPVAIGEKNVYFMLGREFVPRASLKSPITVGGVMDLYGEYYGDFDGIVGTERTPMREVLSVYSRFGRDGIGTHPPEREWRCIGAGLRSTRESLGATMGELADALGITVCVVSDREMGRVAWTPAMLREHLGAMLSAANSVNVSNVQQENS